MIQFDITRLVPKFLLRDKNGAALAAAIEAALNALDDVASVGLACLSDVESMPEWRLDELAWEYNCLYDYEAGITEKRAWIREAFPMYRYYGTPEAIYQYLRGAFNEVEVEEWWQYGADPFHFRVIVGGEWTDAKEAWARYAVRVASNIRSILDGISAGSSGAITMSAVSAQGFKFYYPAAGTELCGELP